MGVIVQTKILQDFPVIIEVNVAWGEMDAYQHVNNIVYFRYFESARYKYLEKIDFTDRVKNNGIGPILGYTQCKFLRALTYPDTISVGARTTEIRDDRYIMEVKIYSPKYGALAAVGTADMVAFDYNKNKKAVLPAHIRKNIEALEGRTF